MAWIREGRKVPAFYRLRTMRCQTNEALHAKIFIAFVALIIRNRIRFLLKEQMLKTSQKENDMTVPAAIRELEKLKSCGKPIVNIIGIT